MFITFEGIEGCGKTTQIELLYTYLKGRGRKIVKTREPGGTPFGEALRKVFLHERMDVYPLPELLVFMAMRAQHVEEIIRPALEEGVIVLCDRFADATYAYQGYGRGMDMETIGTLNRLATKDLRPDLTILLECPVNTGLKRKVEMNSTDRFEEEDASFHKNIQSGYEQIAKGEPKRFFIIDGTLDREKIHDAIKTKVEEVLKHHGL